MFTAGRFPIDMQAKARQGGLWVACVASVSVRKNLEREQKTVSSSFLVLFSFQLLIRALPRAETLAYGGDQVL